MSSEDDLGGTVASAAAPVALEETLDASRVPLLPGGDLRRVARADYERGAELARGGMGRIVAARDVRHDRPVALKELLHRSPALVARFRREALIAARMQHPAIVPIYEAGTWEDGEPFFAMKRVEGRSLDAVIADRLELRDRLELLPNVIAVAEALAYAHARGVIHRDLKPHNVLIGDYGETVVIDWGLAKDLRAEDDDDAALALSMRPTATASGGLTLAGHALGTPAYMPPEQARGEEVDARADVYALGAILYHVLAGMVPYGAAATAQDLLLRVATVPPTPLRDLQLDLPDDLLTIVDKAMARDAAERYPDAGALAADLRRFAAGQLVSAHSYSLRALLSRFVHRHRVPVGAVGLLAIAAIVGLVLYVRAVGVERAATERERERAEANAAEAEAQMAHAKAQTVGLLEEQGVSRLAEGQPLQAAVYLARSYALGNRGAAVRFALARAMRAAASVPLRGHDGPVVVGAFAGDGSRVVTAGHDGTVRLWDAATGAQLASHDGAGVARVATEPGGVRAAAIWEDGKGWIFEVATGDVQSTLEAQPGTTAMTFTPDGARLATIGATGTLRLADALTGQTLWTVAAHPGMAREVEASPDGALLRTAGDDGTTRLWRRADGAAVATLPGGLGRFGPDGAVVAIAPVGAPAGRWDARTGRRLGDLVVVDGADRMVVSSRGVVATARGDGDDVVLAELATGRRLAVLDGAGRGVRALAFDATGAWLVTGGMDRVLRVWDVAGRARSRR
ncbi:MAG: protein kinase [Kofleriaceae bacterium]|nr:protein kinase [Kofleriaceae bacterium]